MTAGATRAARVAATRRSILDAAERLFAEHGIAAVSGRQISEAAGQGNTAAVGYHFGTKTELVRAVARRHVDPIERRRAERIEAVGDSDSLREWIECLVLPATDHLASLGGPTWFGRFAARVMADQELRPIIQDEGMSPHVNRALSAGLDRCLAGLAPEVRAERDTMAKQLVVLMPSTRETMLAAGAPTPRATWQEAGAGLVDALVGLYLAPATPAPR